MSNRASEKSKEGSPPLIQSAKPDRQVKVKNVQVEQHNGRKTKSSQSQQQRQATATIWKQGQCNQPRHSGREFARRASEQVSMNGVGQWLQARILPGVLVRVN